MTVQELINELEKMPKQYRNCDCIVAYNKPVSEPDMYGRMITEVYKDILFTNCIYGVRTKEGQDLSVFVIKVEKDA